MSEIDKWSLWSRNVIDEYKELPTEEIKKRLKEKLFPFAVCFENVIGDFNMAAGIRNANAFGAREVFYIGNKRFDRRGCVGTYKYTDVVHLASLEELTAKKTEYAVVGVDNVSNAKPLSSITEYDGNTLFVFGEEGRGISKETLAICDAVIEIPLFGSVRSINVACAAGIVMFDYISKRQRGCAHPSIVNDECVRCRKKFPITGEDR